MLMPVNNYQDLLNLHPLDRNFVQFTRLDFIAHSQSRQDRDADIESDELLDRFESSQFNADVEGRPVLCEELKDARARRGLDIMRYKLLLGQFFKGYMSAINQSMMRRNDQHQLITMHFDRLESRVHRVV